MHLFGFHVKRRLTVISVDIVKNGEQFARDAGVVDLLGRIVLPVIRSAPRISKSEIMKSIDTVRCQDTGKRLPAIGRLRFAIDRWRRNVRFALDIADASFEHGKHPTPFSPSFMR